MECKECFSVWQSYIGAVEKVKEYDFRRVYLKI
jgi:hypothetical protein